MRFVDLYVEVSFILYEAIFQRGRFNGESFSVKIPDHIEFSADLIKAATSFMSVDKQQGTTDISIYPVSMAYPCDNHILKVDFRRLPFPQLMCVFDEMNNANILKSTFVVDSEKDEAWNEQERMAINNANMERYCFFAKHMKTHMIKDEIISSAIESSCFSLSYDAVKYLYDMAYEVSSGNGYRDVYITLCDYIKMCNHFNELSKEESSVAVIDLCKSSRGVIEHTPLILKCSKIVVDLQEAVRESCNEMREITGRSAEYTWKDFVSTVPNVICKNYGIEKISVNRTETHMIDETV